MGSLRQLPETGRISRPTFTLTVLIASAISLFASCESFSQTHPGAHGFRDYRDPRGRHNIHELDDPDYRDSRGSLGFRGHETYRFGIQLKANIGDPQTILKPEVLFNQLRLRTFANIGDLDVELDFRSSRWNAWERENWNLGLDMSELEFDVEDIREAREVLEILSAPDFEKRLRELRGDRSNRIDIRRSLQLDECIMPPDSTIEPLLRFYRLRLEPIRQQIDLQQE